jgi:hypothetical protein
MRHMSRKANGRGWTSGTLSKNVPRWTGIQLFCCSTVCGWNRCRQTFRGRIDAMNSLRSDEKHNTFMMAAKLNFFGSPLLRTQNKPWDSRWIQYIDFSSAWSLSRVSEMNWEGRLSPATTLLPISEKNQSEFTKLPIIATLWPVKRMTMFF